MFATAPTMREDIAQTRAADDFATIRARIQELRREPEQAVRAEEALPSEPVPVWVNRIGQVAIAVRRLRDEAG
jgi:hypothetical protein